MSFNPFLIVGSFEGQITNAERLVLLPSFMDTRLEDPPLAPHGSGPNDWHANVVNLQAVLADGIHALAAYYADAMFSNGVGASSTPNTDDGRREPFTTLHCIAASAEEAALMSKSLATFGFDVPPASITVSLSDEVWRASVSAWLAASDRPFVFASSKDGSNGTSAAAYAAAASLADSTKSGVVAIAGPEPSYGVSVFPFSPSSPQVDVLFASTMRDWWTPAAQSAT